MGRRYCALGTQNLTTTPGLGIVELSSATTIKPKVYDLIWGASETAPADHAITYYMNRHTTSGTGGTTETAVALDPGDPASLAAVESDNGVNGTLTPNEELLRFGLNLRASFRWVASPGGEIVLPAAAANGVTFLGLHASATNLVECTIYWEE